MEKEVKAMGHKWVWCPHFDHRIADGVRCFEMLRVKGGRHCSSWKKCDYKKEWEEKYGKKV